MLYDIMRIVGGLIIAKSRSHILMKYGKEMNGQPKLVYTSQHHGIGDGLRDERPMTTE